MNKSKKMLILAISVIFIVALLGVTYAWFNYYQEGTNKKLVMGDIYMTYNEGNETLSLSNVFPETAEEARARKDNYLTFTVEGLNTSNKDIYYEIKLNYGASQASPKERFNDKDLRFDLVELDSNGNEVTYLLSAETYESINNQRIWVETIDANTSSQVTKRYKLRMWLKENVVISDTALDKDYPTTGEGSYPNRYASVKVSVYGDLEEKEINKSLYEIMRETAVMDNTTSTFVNASTGIDFSAISGDNNGKGVYTRVGTQNGTYPIMYYRGAVTDNNVKFANKCWKIVRTTDTGGVKLIYNGEYTEQGKCNNTGSSSQITLTENNTSVNTFKFNENTNSPAYVGYMYGTVYEYSTANWTSGAKFGSSFTWDGTNYKLVDATVTTPDATHHYSCNSTDANATCTNLRYVYYGTSTKYYITLTGGDGVEEALAKMQTNTTNSNAKNKIETWYASNMTSYTSKIEDTIYCNDRSAYSLGGWNSNGGSLSETSLNYGAMQRVYVNQSPSIVCSNKNDSFTWKNGNGNQKLQYPVGLLTIDEMVMAGGMSNSNTSYYLTTGEYYWSLSPSYFNYDYAHEFRVVGDGYLSSDYYYSSDILGLRPVVSLKPGTPVVSGTGTVSDPYVIE